MKPYCSFVALILSMALFASCAKETPDTPNEGGETTTVASLKAPAGFDWQMTTDVSCRIQAAQPTRVCVALSTDGKPFADFTAGPDTEPVTLSIPSSVKVLYVKYETGEGLSQAQAVTLTGGSFDWTVPAVSKALTRAGALTRAQDYGLIDYPANGLGTLLFEDLWPSYGDFDFNDMVVEYGITLYPNNKNMVKSMKVSVRMRAVGGSLPYDLHMAIPTIWAAEIDEIQLLSARNAKEEISMELLNPGNSVHDAPLFRFNGMKNNANRLPGAAYLNTERGYEMDDSKLVDAYFEVTFRNSIKIADLPAKAFDFFIARSDVNKEIHCGGAAPLLYGDDNYHALRMACPVTDENAEFYYSNDNKVWALNIPQLIPHPFEKTDFLSAYPNFAKWVESAGTTNTDWYTNQNGNRVDNNLVNASAYR